MKQTCEWPNKTIDCGVLAKAAMVDLTIGAEVRCDPMDTDRYGRTVAICYAGGFDIGQNMVHTGWALAYRQYSEQYVIIEDQARENQRGLWRGEFMPPWEWRRQNKND